MIGGGMVVVFGGVDVCGIGWGLWVMVVVVCLCSWLILGSWC